MEAPTDETRRNGAGKLCGVVDLDEANAVVVDPVRLLSSCYCFHTVSRAGYYGSRWLDSGGENQRAEDLSLPPPGDGEGTGTRKRKRRKKEAQLNEKEILAEARHQQARSAILNAHAALMKVGTYALEQDEQGIGKLASNSGQEDVDFVRLAELWQAPLYEIVLGPVPVEAIAGGLAESAERRQDNELETHQLFNTLISNDSQAEVTAECAGRSFLLPRNSRFLISDVKKLAQLIPVDAGDGYNLLLLDPPWENKSVHRKCLYPTLPNRRLLSLPIQRLVHPAGALVGLWITNREKLHQFVERQLFPAWGVVLAATWYWLKVTPDGKMLSPLDLAHHKPYECLLLGYVCGPEGDTTRHATELRDKHVIISVPGAHSRKPALGSLLMRHAPGPRPVKALELFARELNPGWTSWGNEPLHFQNFRYFIR